MSVDVANTGARAGDEVVQLYIRDVVSSVTRPTKELRGFERVTLAPGQSRTVTFTLGPDALSLIDRDMRRVVEPGRFDVMVGTSSAQLTTAALDGGRALIMSGLDWIVIGLVLRAAAGIHVVVGPAEPRHGGRLLPRRPQSRLGRGRRLDLRLEHRLGASRRPRRRRRDQRRGAGPLRTARLVSAGARLGDGAVLPAVRRVHDAGVPRAPLLAGGAHGPLAHLAGRLRADQDRRRHLRRRRRLRHTAPGDAGRRRRRDLQQLLDRIGAARDPRPGCTPSSAACAPSRTPRRCRPRCSCSDRCC